MQPRRPLAPVTPLASAPPISASTPAMPESDIDFATPIRAAVSSHSSRPTHVPVSNPAAPGPDPSGPVVHPAGHSGGYSAAPSNGGGVGVRTSIDFAEAARQLSDQARSLGLLVPVFRSPPRVVGLSRTLRRRNDGSVSVAVAFKRRPWSAVLADMVEGIVAANQLSGPVAARARDDLWAAFEVSIAAAA